jgi:diacylglycerol kinase family enzyme
MKRRVSLIFNPVAGQGDPDVDLEEISSLLDSEIDLDVVITTAESKPGDLAKAAILQGRGFANERGAEAIIAAGAMVPSPLWRRR